MLFVKHVHLQNDAGASHQIEIVSLQSQVSDSNGTVNSLEANVKDVQDRSATTMKRRLRLLLRSDMT